MANTTTSQDDKTKLLDQMLEDIAGEEFSEYGNDFELDSELDKFSTTDEFANIDSYH